MIDGGIKYLLLKNMIIVKKYDRCKDTSKKC